MGATGAPDTPDSEGRVPAWKNPSSTPPEGPAPTELQIIDLEEGTGPEAAAGRQVAVHYVGVAFSTGEQFDSSYDRGTPLTFPLGAGRVIPGWDNGLIGMKVGGRRRLEIPPAPGLRRSWRRWRHQTGRNPDLRLRPRRR